jgi:hypothetical protein
MMRARNGIMKFRAARRLEDNEMKIRRVMLAAGWSAEQWGLENEKIWVLYDSEMAGHALDREPIE